MWRFGKAPLFLILVLAAPIFWFGLWVMGADLTLNFSQPAGFYLSAIIIYPLAEEILFRGVLQEYFEKKNTFQRTFLSISIANILTSLLFCLMHLYSHSALWSALTFFPSIAFGYSKHRYNTLLAPISLHIIYNAGYFILYS